MDWLLKNKLRCITTTTNEQEEGVDRISNLPDELIHHILSFSDVKLAVQTSVLAKRWRLIWTTLSYLNVNLILFHRSAKFVDSFLSHRNHDSAILKLELFCCYHGHPGLAHKIVSYAISHNVQDLNVDIPHLKFGASKLFTFSSTSIKKLALTVTVRDLSESDCWNLPALTTLHLINPLSFCGLTFPKSYLICLPSLRTLLLVGFELPESISLPALTTLYLAKCQLPPTVCDFPALVTLTLDCVEFPKSTSEFFPALVNLQNLTLFFWTSIRTDWVIDCPQLLNLEINDHQGTISRHSGKIMVLAPKICNFSSVGFFPITFGVSQLENVNVKLRGSIFTTPWKKLKKYYRGVTHMFTGLSSARILTLDLKTIEALSAVSNYFISFHSPFYNLKYMKVPERYKESSIPTCLKRYLLGGSPKATIVTTPPQDELIPQMLPVFLTAKELLPGNPLATLVARAGNDLASYSRVAIDFGLWQGHEVNSEFSGLVDCIVKKYPETFDYFTINSKKFCTMRLNMLGTIVKAFMRTSMAEVDTEMISVYRALFADLQRSFNIKWLVKRLNYIEQLQFSHAELDKLHTVDSCIDDTKTKLQDLQAFPMRMMTEIHKDVGTMGNSLAVGYIGDDLFSGP